MAISAGTSHSKQLASQDNSTSVGVGIAAGGVLRYDMIRQGRIAIHIAIYWAFSAQSYLDCQS